METKIVREKNNEWCEVRIEIKKGRLSVSGAYGHIISYKQAKKEAFEYWKSFFEEQPEEIFNMNQKQGTRFSSPSGAAKYVLQVDGDLHGIDVHEQDEEKVFVTESCGQIRETIERFFPEVKPLFSWHLNDMHAECEHQEKRGETYQTHPNAVCPNCGYKLGSAWTKRELPKEIVKLASSIK